MKSSSLVFLPAVASSFSMVVDSLPRNTLSQLFMAAEGSSDMNSSSNTGEEEEPPPEPEPIIGLVLTGLDDQLRKVKGQFETYEMDYLAAAKRRAELKVQSIESGAKDEDWYDLAQEKKGLFGEIDDWENAKKEAGNVDSQILMFTTPPPPTEDEDGDGTDEPKLLLF
jgi:hypothetical protein